MCEAEFWAKFPRLPAVRRLTRPPPPLRMFVCVCVCVCFKRPLRTVSAVLCSVTNSVCVVWAVVNCGGCVAAVSFTFFRCLSVGCSGDGGGR